MTKNQHSDSSDPKFYRAGKFQPKLCADWLIKNYHIIRLSGNELHWYDKRSGLYVNNDYGEIQSFIINSQKNDLGDFHIGQVMNRLQYTAPIIRTTMSEDLIAFNNGVYNLETGRLSKFDADKFIFTSKLKVDFVNPSSADADTIAFVDKFFNDIAMGDTELITLLYEIIGSCCYRSSDLEMCFICHGNGGNAKSRFFDIIQALVGSSCSNLRLRDIMNNRFAVSNLQNMTVNISHDEEQMTVNDIGLLKALVSGNPIQVDKKYEIKQIQFAPYTTFLIGTNNLIDFKDSSDGFRRKFRIVPFRNKFTGTNRDFRIARKLCSLPGLEVIAYRAMKCFTEVVHRGYFTEPASVIAETDDYLLDTIPLMEFVQEFPIDDRPGHKISTESYFNLYKDVYCKEHQQTPITTDLSKFGGYLRSHGIKHRRIFIDYFGRKLPFYITDKYSPKQDIDKHFQKYSFNQLASKGLVKGWDWYESGWYDKIKDSADLSDFGLDTDLDSIVISDLIEHRMAPVRIADALQVNSSSPTDDDFKIPF